MHKKISVVSLLAVYLLFLTSITGHVNESSAQINRPQFVPGEVLIKVKGDVSVNQINTLQNQIGTQTVQYFDFIDVLHLKLPKNMSVENAVQTFEQHPLIQYVVPNHLYYLDATFPNDPNFTSMWNLHSTGQDGGLPDADIDAPEAWSITTGSNDVVIAVIDSGVDLNHEDLAANIWTNPGEIPNNGIDDDKNGFIDDVHGWDFSADDNDPSPAGGACVGHGTHVAGTIGAMGNNNVGVVGVNWNVKIMPLKTFQIILGSLCTTSTADVVAAIRYATKMGVRVSNNSWGGLLPDLAIIDAIIASKSVFVAAAGNGFLDQIGDNNDTTPFFPAGYELDNIIAVAATDRNDQLAGFSNFGLASVDLAAPGVSILSTLPNNDYNVFSGTSMATPHVAGMVGLLLAQDPTLTNREIKWRILNGTDNIGLPVLSGGRLNAHQTLQFGQTTPAVTVEVIPLSPTTVSPGGLFLWRIIVINNEASPSDLTFTIYIQFDFGLEIPLYQVSASLGSNEMVVDNILSLMPPFFPPGTKFRLFAQAATTDSFDEDWIEYVTGSFLINTNQPYKVYLPIIQAGDEHNQLSAESYRKHLNREYLYAHFFKAEGQDKPVFGLDGCSSPTCSR